MPATLTRRALARRPLPAGPRIAATPAVVLGVILACYLMFILDVSIVTTALPTIHRDLGFSDAGLSWVQNAYTLTFGGLLLLGARAGDLLGRRRTFVGGIVIFTLGSMLGGLAQSAGWLLAARALQGAGAAVAAPSTLALLTVSFREGHERTRAIAAYSAVAGGGGSLGLVLGGLLTSAASWRWGLFINVPIGAALLWLAPHVLPETERHTGRFDLPGALTSTLGMTALVYGFVRAASDGWGDDGTVASFAAAVVLLTAFVATELRAEQPITPLRLFASRQRSGAYVARMLLVSGMFASFFFMSQYLQGVLGFSALRTGFAFLPLTLVLFGTVQLVPRIVGRVGNAPLLIGGLVVALAGMAWLSRLSPGASYLTQIALPLVLLGIGVGAALTPLTSAGVAGVAEGDAGAASGLVNTFHQLGGSLGLGILVTVFSSAGTGEAGRAALSDGVRASLTGSVVFLALALLVATVVMHGPAIPWRSRAVEAEGVAG